MINSPKFVSAQHFDKKLACRLGVMVLVIVLGVNAHMGCTDLITDNLSDLANYSAITGFPENV